MRETRTIVLALGVFAFGIWVGTLQWPSFSGPSPEQPPPVKKYAWPYVEQTGIDDGDSLRERQRLDALGYLDASSVAAPESGVVKHSSDAWPGLNLVVSGHEAGAALMDMDGRLLHRWACPATSLWTDADPEAVTAHRYWRRVELLEDGGLLALFDYHALIRLDRNSQLVWQLRRPFHHEIRLAPNGNFLTLERRTREDPEILASGAFFDDLLVEIDGDGQVLREVSLTDALMKSHLSPILRARLTDREDLLHANTVHPLDGSSASTLPAFAAGNVLVSLRHLDTVAVVDLAKARVVWALVGIWRAQHDPVLLENGRILVYDNTGLGTFSRVIEIDPVSQEVHWAYEGNPENGFFSECCGTNQRLANGNTLIVDTSHGRAFEATPANEIVWSWISPHRRENQVAALFEMRRLPLDAVPWIGSGADIPSGGQCPVAPK